MEEVDKGCPMIRMGVSGWLFLLVLAYLGSPGPKTVKRLCVCVCYKAVKTGTGQRKVMPSGWEGNHKSGIGITLLKAQGLSTCAYGLNLIKGDEHPTYSPRRGPQEQSNTSVLERLPTSTRRKNQCSVVSDPIQWHWATCGWVFLEVIFVLKEACESQQQVYGDGLHQEHCVQCSQRISGIVPLPCWKAGDIQTLPWLLHLLHDKCKGSWVSCGEPCIRCIYPGTQVPCCGPSFTPIHQDWSYICLIKWVSSFLTVHQHIIGHFSAMWYLVWCLTSRSIFPAGSCRSEQDLVSADTREVYPASQIDKWADHFNLSICTWTVRMMSCVFTYCCMYLLLLWA